LFARHGNFLLAGGPSRSPIPENRQGSLKNRAAWREKDLIKKAGSMPAFLIYEMQNRRPGL